MKTSSLAHSGSLPILQVKYWNYSIKSAGDSINNKHNSVVAICLVKEVITFYKQGLI